MSDHATPAECINIYVYFRHFTIFVIIIIVIYNRVKPLISLLFYCISTSFLFLVFTTLCSALFPWVRSRTHQYLQPKIIMPKQKQKSNSFAFFHGCSFRALTLFINDSLCIAYFVLCILLILQRLQLLNNHRLRALGDHILGYRSVVADSGS